MTNNDQPMTECPLCGAYPFAPDDKLGMATHMSDWHRDLQRFLDQNSRAAETISPEQCEDIAPYAQHHAGGLYVLLGFTHDGLCVKLHDSWGDDEHIVVHTYDPDDANGSSESEIYCPTGLEAVEVFLDLAV